jgi:hypothetical protein
MQCFFGYMIDKELELAFEQHHFASLLTAG